MTDREWKTKALGYLIRMKEWRNSPYRQEREYSNYLKRFFFGECEPTLDGKNETWQKRRKMRELPMSTNMYLYG